MEIDKMEIDMDMDMGMDIDMGTDMGMGMGMDASVPMSRSVKGDNEDGGTASFRWRTRDTVQELLLQRVGSTSVSVPLPSASTPSLLSSPTKVDAAILPAAVVASSSHFDVDTCLARIRRDKAIVVRTAFGAAATAVIHAKSQLQQDKHTNQHQHNPSQKKDQMTADNMPRSLTKRNKLEEMRVTSLERAHTNKEVKKNKTAVAVDHAVSAPASATKRTAKKGNTDGTDSADPTTHVDTGTGTVKQISNAVGSTPSTSGKKNASLDAPGSSSKVAATGGGGISATPGPTAAVDSRSTVSRAIICTAASIAFDSLTPLLESHEIDVLDVPQNTARVTVDGTTVAVVNPTILPQQQATTTSATIPTTTASTSSSSSASNAPAVNMGAVSLQAKTLGQRACYLAENAATRSQQRYDYRRDNAKYEQKEDNDASSPFHLFSNHPFRSNPNDGNDSSTYDNMEEEEGDLVSECRPAISSKSDASCGSDAEKKNLTREWTKDCLPRLTSILHRGSGHAIYCDRDWPTRHGRIANLLQQLANNRGENDCTDNAKKSKNSNFGPHLIVTTHPQVEAFAREFNSINRPSKSYGASSSDSVLSTDNNSKVIPSPPQLRVLAYGGSTSKRRKLRGQFADATGLADAPFHVIVTSYAALLKDYLHFCQVPFQVVLLDEGFSWMSLASADPNGSMGNLWENGIWSSSDQHIGLAGTSHHQVWDFCAKTIDEEHIKNACIGLTARHRILTTPTMSMRHRETLYLAPVGSLVNFFLPQFTDVVREEWDRSRIVNDPASMDHMRKLLTRSVVVHCPFSSIEKNDGNNDDNRSLYELAMNAMRGTLAKSFHDSVNPDVPCAHADEILVSDGKISQSRRFALSWLGPSPLKSWLRYELGSAVLQPVLDAMKRSGAHGHVCEEVVTASSTTSSGAGGTVSGTQAYRLAVRCGRNFGSEQGLRQHMAALHAPPGTWLCRTCGMDCGTSQARTHHERSCGQPAAIPGGSSAPGASAGGGVSTVGQGMGSGGKPHGPTGVVGKNASSRSVGKASSTGAAGPEDKDKDGSFRVPGYRGVWVNPAGKHFVKINGRQLTTHKGNSKTSGSVIQLDNDAMFFDSVEDAAKTHDESILAKSGQEAATELNFRPDGTRIIYEDNTAAAAAGRGLEMLGGGASSVVPALSVINIKDLPKHVKPLLRDPRQTSRTGGNSKRHVYAYRGVCRQARKGHDRWQSQISFGGTNHYLGTFDSEWDAAAIYAWAHLILYGEEATKIAQKEGEEAAAAYEQEKHDIATGKVILPPPKATKKKKEKKVKEVKKEEEKLESPPLSDKSSTEKNPGRGKGNPSADDNGGKGKTLKKRSVKESPSAGKKPKVAPKQTAKGDFASLAPYLSRGVTTAPVLAPRKAFNEIADDELIKSVSQRILSIRKNGYFVSDVPLPAPMVQEIRPCAPVQADKTPSGTAMLFGLSAGLFGWDVQSFISSCHFESIEESDEMCSLLEDEYEYEGTNELFRTVMQGSVCVIGRAGRNFERASEALGLGSVPLGGTVGDLDCNIGGINGSCSEAAAVIQHSPAGGSDFQFSAFTGTKDVVTLNGQRINGNMGSFPLFNEDVCTVGARVFVFLLPLDA